MNISHTTYEIKLKQSIELHIKATTIKLQEENIEYLYNRGIVKDPLDKAQKAYTIKEKAIIELNKKLLFSALLLFIISELFVFQPNYYDNNKLLSYLQILMLFSVAKIQQEYHFNKDL